jgi:uncharacterized protein YkwD/thiol-disulfide isomerase/thioredoxin
MQPLTNSALGIQPAGYSLNMGKNGGCMKGRALLLIFVLMLVVQIGFAQSVGDMAPNFTATDAAGKQHSIAQYKGSVILLKFWAEWCPPCVSSLPGSWAKHNKYASQGLVIFTVGLSTAARDRALLSSKGYSFPVMVAGKEIRSQIPYSFRGIPYEVLISRSGKILWTGHPLSLRESVLEAALKETAPGTQTTSSQQPDATWQLRQGMAPTARGSWGNEIRRVNQTSLENAKEIASKDARITYFFFVTSNNVRIPRKGFYRKGDAVFFSGTPNLKKRSTMDTWVKATTAETTTAIPRPGITAKTTKWNSAMYPRYTHKTFGNTAMAKQAIDMNTIDYELLGAAIFYATNIEREKNNKPLFKPSMILYKAAYMHSYDMVQRNFFSHTNPIAGKTSPSDRVRQFGTWQQSVGENIANTFAIQYKAGTRVSSFDNIPPHSYWSYALAVVETWMNSPGHKRNILNERFMRLGAAGYQHRNSSNVPYIKATQVFAGGTSD